ncbi:MAG: asparagine synthase (glutamine-hydrolyzing) [Myxococcota bacterium]
MCGVTGFIDPEARTPNPDEVLRRMQDALTHRGPDDSGSYTAAPVWLAHTRLSIVGLADDGRQPFVLQANPSEPPIVVAANGEIYNHEALRETIRNDGHLGARLPTSDCGVLPWLWRRDASRAVASLRGMYGLAVWDGRDESLTLARDPAGQKPMYYAPLPGGGVAFASEVKALLAHPLVTREVDPIGLQRYLTFDFIPGEATIYRGVRRVPAGHTVRWARKTLTSQCIASVPSAMPKLHSLEEAESALWSSLGTAVEQRLMSDVPLGVFLSGGLDSTALVAILAERVDPSRLKTFSVAFEDPTFDESSHARRVATHFGTDHAERTLTAEHLLALVPDLLATLDEPFADPSIVPTSLLSAFAREQVTVALGGEGGDELLLGYPTFYAERWASHIERTPRWLRRFTLDAAVRCLPVGTGNMNLGFKARRFLLGLDRIAAHRHMVWIGGVPPEQHAEALAPEIRWSAGPTSAVFEPVDELMSRFRRARPESTHLDALGWLYEQTYLADGVLTKVDRASMAHALEVRAPMLDAEFRAVCARIPTQYKLRGVTTKAVLRRCLMKRAPSDIVSRPKKGFGIPVASWLRGPLKDWMQAVLQRERVAGGGLLNPDWTERLMKEHLSGTANHRKALWSALCLELWRSGPYGPDGGRS